MGKVALITGASRGIGAATARLLAQQGYRLCLNYLREAASAEALAEALRAQGAEVITVQADVADEADVVRLFETLDARLGPLDALVNNAGILLPQRRVEDLDAARINRLLTTNVTSQFLCCREAVRRMSRRHGGRGGAIVNVSSVAARLGSPHEYVDYAASKGAIDTLARGLALEVAGEGIRVNGVRPGFIHTQMHGDGGEPGRVARLAPQLPLGRGGEPDEVAAAIRWLLSDEAAYVTGAFIDLAGGR
ncbi:SDR family oxidoreductase [Aeromonas bivalvium]|uniref:SDR family oxidoreductase n=1 Tax=Aeromonas bivalvium TaxID=440079 RepID=UPI0038D19E75